MNLPRRIISFKYPSKISSLKIIIFLFFILLHLLLFNVNTAEWGDSYKILRASEFIKEGSYPADEKRPPTFSMVLALRPFQMDAILWGRGIMLIFSILSFIVFDKLISIFIKEKKYKLISLIIFTLNPVYLYWSLRIMADVPFSFLVLLSSYLLTRWKNSLSIWKSVLIGLICGLAILTRFEGYILLLSMFVGILFVDIQGQQLPFKLKNLLGLMANKLSYLLSLGLTTLVVILPWVLYRNPFSSKYFNEPSGRTYDLKMVWTYFSSLFYLFGFSSAFYFILKSFFSNLCVAKFLKENIGITLFLSLELILILLWPAAIPRLFVSVIPFLIILFSLSFKEYEESNLSNVNITDVCFLVLILMFYVLSQFILKLQFLIVIRAIFVVIILLQAVSILFIYLRKFNPALLVYVLSAFVWSLSTVYIHKDIYTAIKQASLYAVDNLEGKVVYNDTTSVAQWYLNYFKQGNFKGSTLYGEYLDMRNLNNLNSNVLSSSKVSYVILTNEDGINYESEIEKLKYLNLIKDFRYNIGDKQFFAKIFKFNGGTFK